MTEEASPTPELPILPAHIEDTVQAISRLHAAHKARATPLQRYVERLIAGAGRPAFAALLAVVVSFWMVLNFGMMALGHKPLDEPPFFWLQGLVALAALFSRLEEMSTMARITAGSRLTKLERDAACQSLAAQVAAGRVDPADLMASAATAPGNRHVSRKQRMEAVSAFLWADT